MPRCQSHFILPDVDEYNRKRLLRRERLNSIASASLHGINRDLLLQPQCEEKRDSDIHEEEEFLKEVSWHSLIGCGVSSRRRNGVAWFACSH